MATTRQNLHTQISPLAKRQDVWQAAVTAAERHVKIGNSLQSQGAEILSRKHEADADGMAKLIQQATSTIDKGVKIERDARDKLIDLYTQEPR